MAKFLIETLATIKHVYPIEAENEEAAIDKYLNQDTIKPATFDYVGELISNVEEACCDEHFQQLLNSTKDEPEEKVIELGIRSLN